MKMLLTAPPGVGHMLPLVPMAQAALAAGHEVLFATTGPNLGLLSCHGVPTVDAASHADVAARFHQLNQDTNRPGMPAEEVVSVAIAAWAEIGDLMLDGLLRTIRRWRADVVVHEPYHVAGLAAAQLAGVPAVLHGTGLPMRTFRRALEKMVRPPERYGAGEPSTTPDAVVNVCPSSMTSPDREHGWPMRYVPADVGAAASDWEYTRPSVPRICVSFGSVLPGMGKHMIRVTAEALRELDAEVLVSTGGAALDGWGPLPANVRLARWLPMSAVLPGCVTVIHHGGSGTVFGALAAGVPQVLLPQGSDQPKNAEAVVRRGVGIALDTTTDGAETLGKAVRQVLADPSYSRAAQEVARENSARPAPSAVVAQIARLA
jgi:UDP:flavonoid glycosyltransferase YjiC (YdhE family)